MSVIKEIIDKETMARSLKRIAHEILERNKGTKDLIIVGIKTKGVYIATRIAKHIQNIEDVKVPVGELDITNYRDDLKTRSKIENTSNITVSVEGKKVVLIDDVLYTGRTVRAALDAIMDYGRANEIQLAILIDRGHRELPIRPDYVGKNLPTSKQEQILVKLSEKDGTDGVFISKHS